MNSVINRWIDVQKQKTETEIRNCKQTQRKQKTERKQKHGQTDRQLNRHEELEEPERRTKINRMRKDSWLEKKDQECGEDDMGKG